MKTKLITREGYNKLKQEHDYLWNERRPEVTKIVTWAASLGDRSENADYTFNKRLLRQIDRRVRFLRKFLPEVTIVDYSPQQEGKVFFGAWVEIENEEGETMHFRIVGPEEIYGDAKGYISIDSPMARALLKKQVDDEVVVKTPQGDREWFINSITYQQHSE
ncbi:MULTISPECIES: transcription elongation factor GreB [Vibrio]|jgi:transcription elongation factor GreB|uniref:Transcription elongation factor GreB n=1 Tax=Vibrio mediterranei TaxID=689 RepID=A0AAN1FEV2_9VIBR|nr:MULTISPECIES: transcription elongation factor GreB [Vibrio]ASI89290.1 transcription elongation factor GreB [Vibrio mediterranei]KFA95221.1 transcription elongation factor GreB [Vibrio sp. ER1A]MCG9624354.1 transcription elongation factor GreB [Vibrio mediterranei]MCG9657602.1 transcription elongation factor GreB [Vibrio mediterranei]MCG9666149.1 transcription elongation factor GreB [Vibrio mediterranei]